MEQVQIEMKDLQLSSDAMEVEDDYSDIKLRLIDFSDIDYIKDWLMDEKVSKFCSWDYFTSEEAALNYVTSVIIPHPWLRAICLKDKPIGSISVTPFHGNAQCRGEIGYVLASQYWGKGIATQAVKLVASTIFVEWPHLERLEALVDVENIGSQRVLEKVGFSKEGVLRKYCLLKGKARDMVMFSLLSADYQVNYLR